MGYRTQLQRVKTARTLVERTLDDLHLDHVSRGYVIDILKDIATKINDKLKKVAKS